MDREPHHARTRSRFWRILRGLGFALLLLAVVLASLFFYYRWSGDGELEAVVAELDREQSGWRWDELQAARRSVPDSENSALHTIALVNSLPKNWDATENHPENEPHGALDKVPPPRMLSPVHAERIRARLEPLRNVIAQAHELVKYEHGRFPLNISPDFISTLLTNQQQGRDLVRLLDYEHRLRCQDSEPRAAWQTSLAMLHVSRAYGDEPILISQLIRMALQSLTVASLERTLALSELANADLADMQPRLRREAAEPLFYYAMRGERAGCHILCSKLAAGSVSLATIGNPKTSSVSITESLLASVLTATNIQRSHAWMLQYDTKILKTEQMAGLQKYQQLQAIEQEMSQELKRYDLLIARVLMPACVKVGDAERRVDTLLSCADTGLAAERFRLQKQRWPATLQELVDAGLLSAVPIDLFDGQPLRLRRSKDGLVIYSVGKDGKYDGTGLDKLTEVDESLIRVEFRLWDVGQRRQPPLPPRPKAEF